MNYLRKIKQLFREGRENEAVDVLLEGMAGIGGEVVEVVNRHSGDWPLAIVSLRKIATSMENGLSAEGRALLSLIDAAYGVDAKITRTTIDGAELKKQMEGEGK